VVWAATLEATRPGAAVPVLLALGAAGLLRPEAWLLTAAYWCWLAVRATWRQRICTPRWPRAARCLGAVDFLVTGDPLFSLHYTAARPRISAASAAVRAAGGDPGLLREPRQAARARWPRRRRSRSGSCSRRGGC
jgi:hypothetical protein